MIKSMLYCLLLVTQVVINKPIFNGAEAVTGKAQPNAEISLIIVGESEVITTAADNSGNYTFVLEPLQVHALITVWTDSDADFTTVKRPACQIFIPTVEQ